MRFPWKPSATGSGPGWKEAFRSVKGVYAVSDSAMRHFLDLYRDMLAPQTRLAVIPNGVDTDTFIVSPERRVLARKQLGLPPDALVLGCVARLSAQKRPQALLALFARLAPQFPQLISGAGGHGAAGSHAAAAGATDRACRSAWCLPASSSASSC